MQKHKQNTDWPRAARKVMAPRNTKAAKAADATPIPAKTQ
jgi:hypothetical protein